MSSKKLAKVLKKGGSSKALVKAAKKTGEKEGGLGKTGHRVVQALGQLGAGIATKNFGRVTIPFINVRVAPDEALAIVGGAAFLGQGVLGIGKAKAKWAEDAMWSGIQAVIGRFTWNDSITVIQTKDGKVEVKHADATRKTEEQAPPRDVRATVEVDPDTGRPRSVSVDARAA